MRLDFRRAMDNNVREASALHPIGKHEGGTCRRMIPEVPFFGHTDELQYRSRGNHMKTDVIAISSEGGNMEAALAQIDKISEYKKLSPKSAMSLRLLTEETMAMMRAIAGNVNGEFWVEDQDAVYEIHLRVNTLIDEKKREQLLSASTSGKNEAARGFMGKIRAFFEPSSSVPMFSTGFSGGAPQMYGTYVWSMEDYRDQLRQYREQNQANHQEEWDELEKSVVAKMADNVKVSIRGRTVEMTIFKTIGQA